MNQMTVRVVSNQYQIDVAHISCENHRLLIQETDYSFNIGMD